MTSELVKGFKDFSGVEAEKRVEIKKILVDVFEKYGFESAETPIIEYEKFVKGENTDDEVISDIFKLKDKGKRDLALRYEFTFQLKRLAKNKKLPYKRYQIGEVFRDEPVSSNRFRQFTQCDVDIVGSTIKDEAEILTIVKNVLDKLGIKFVIYVNNRKLLKEIIEKDITRRGKLIRLSTRSNYYSMLRKEVPKEVDKLDKLPEYEIRRSLRKLGAEEILDLLKKIKSYKDIEELRKYCKVYKVDFEFSPTLARGLSYYNGNVFEIKVKGMKETIVAGGSYLINGVQSTGISFGLDRLMALAKAKSEKEKILIISLEQDKEAIKIAEKLRGQGKIVSVYYGKPSKALGYANSKEIDKVIFVGEKEIKGKKFKVKDMKSGKESLLKI